MEKRHSQYRHGMSKGRPYAIWNGMLARCHNKKSSNYKKYGAAGIRVCPEWKKDFLNFWNDMKDTYFEGASIDRIDNSLGYSKDNCRWATAVEQARNKRTVKLYTYNGKTMLAEEWDKELGLKKGTVRSRIKYYGWDIERALSSRKIEYENVSLDKVRGTYKTYLKINGKQVFVGRFKTKKRALLERNKFIRDLSRSKATS